jgi:hypothetical protein
MAELLSSYYRDIKMYELLPMRSSVSKIEVLFGGKCSANLFNKYYTLYDRII